MQAVDLFCGAGGGSTGLEKAGVDVVGAADVDEDACDTYAANHDHRPVEVDLSEATFDDLATEWGIDPDEIDIVLGCPPCKPFSSLRRTTGGVDGDRDTLLEAFLRLIGEAKPPVVLFENVQRFAHLEDGQFYDTLVSRMREEGYALDIDVLNAADYGVPQRRNRTIGVFRRDVDEVSLPDPTHSSPDDDGLPDWNTVREAISDLPPVAAGEDAGNWHRATNHPESTLKLIRAVPEDGGSRSAVPEELLADCHKRLGDDEATNVYGRMHWDKPAPTLTTRCCAPSTGRYIHPEQDRAITPREAARLQTFPDSFDLPDTKKAATNAIGNAVPPRLISSVVDQLDPD